MRQECVCSGEVRCGVLQTFYSITNLLVRCCRLPYTWSIFYFFFSMATSSVFHEACENNEGKKRSFNLLGFFLIYEAFHGKLDEVTKLHEYLAFLSCLWCYNPAGSLWSIAGLGLCILLNKKMLWKLIFIRNNWFEYIKETVIVFFRILAFYFYYNWVIDCFVVWKDFARFTFTSNIIKRYYRYCISVWLQIKEFVTNNPQSVHKWI